MTRTATVYTGYRPGQDAQPAESGGPLTEIPPLPFIGNDRPRCADDADTFEIAATEGRPATAQQRALIVAADRDAHTTCRTCPLMNGCREYALTTKQRWGVWGATNLAERITWLMTYGDRIEHLKGLPVNSAERRDAFNDIDTIPLFTPEAASLARATVDNPKRHAIRNTGYGNCPNCSTTGVRLLRVGAHLVWSEHYYRTWAGTTRPCLSSGVAVCVAPEDDGAQYGTLPATCPHATDGKRAGCK